MAAHDRRSATTRTACCVRSTGEPTYFAADIAYHEDKRERGFDRLINVLGADHHGYVARMKAAFAALGGDPDTLELLIMQFVHIVEGGERASMSKRRGDFVTLDDLVERHRRRRRALLPAPALARHDARPRSRPGARAVRREPRLLRPVRARADRLDPAQGGRRAGGGGAGRPAGGRARCEPAERALIKRLLAFPARSREAADAPRAAPHHRLRARARAGLHGLLPRLPRGRRRARARSSPSGSRCRVATQRTIARALDLLGVGRRPSACRPVRCDASYRS